MYHIHLFYSNRANKRAKMDAMEKESEYNQEIKKLVLQIEQTKMETKMETVEEKAKDEDE